jgi:hypothetical protein
MCRPTREQHAAVDVQTGLHERREAHGVHSGHQHLRSGWDWGGEGGPAQHASVVRGAQCPQWEPAPVGATSSDPHRHPARSRPQHPTFQATTRCMTLIPPPFQLAAPASHLRSHGALGRCVRRHRVRPQPEHGGRVAHPAVAGLGGGHQLVVIHHARSGEISNRLQGLAHECVKALPRVAGEVSANAPPASMQHKQQAEPAISTSLGISLSLAPPPQAHAPWHSRPLLPRRQKMHRGPWHSLGGRLGSRKFMGRPGSQRQRGRTHT